MSECCGGDGGCGGGGEPVYAHNYDAHDHGHGKTAMETDGGCCDEGGCAHDHGHAESHGHAEKMDGDCCDEVGCGGCGSDSHGHGHSENVSHSHGHHEAGLPELRIAYWQGWGYAKFATALKAFLEDEFSGRISIKSAVYRGPEKGAFEVHIGTELIHSKLTMAGHGRVQTDEELDNIIDKIQ